MLDWIRGPKKKKKKKKKKSQRQAGHARNKLGTEVEKAPYCTALQISRQTVTFFFSRSFQVSSYINRETNHLLNGK